MRRSLQLSCLCLLTRMDSICVLCNCIPFESSSSANECSLWITDVKTFNTQYQYYLGYARITFLNKRTLKTLVLAAERPEHIDVWIQYMYGLCQKNTEAVCRSAVKFNTILVPTEMCPRTVKLGIECLLKFILFFSYSLISQLVTINNTWSTICHKAPEIPLGFLDLCNAEASAGLETQSTAVWTSKHTSSTNKLNFYP